MILKQLVLLLSGITLSAASCYVSAEELTIPNTFSAGATTSASEVNANFDAIATAVNSIGNRLSELESTAGVQFLGFSTGVVDGGSGLYAMQSACNDSFSGSKVCTSVEYANATYNPDAANMEANAWILPVMTGVGFSSSDKAVLELGSGWVRSSSALSLTCNGYTNRSSNTGFGVSPTGGFKEIACQISHPVACCK